MERTDGATFGELVDISQAGFLIETKSELGVGDTIAQLQLRDGKNVFPLLPSATIVRRSPSDRPGASTSYLGCRFHEEIDLEKYVSAVQPARYVSNDLLQPTETKELDELTLRDHLAFRSTEDRDLFSKCRRVVQRTDEMQQCGEYQSQYRITMTSGLDHRTTAYNPFSQREEEFVCFDSNGYLGLHMDPRVLEATRKALATYGYGTPSVQLLSGTSRPLRELEETISEFHGREDTVLFSSGYTANVAAITALVTPTDSVIVDQYAHASIHDAATLATRRDARVFKHNSAGDLATLLANWQADENGGSLVATDGVFSMQGTVADLPSIARICRQYNSYLMVDEAHSTGVVGPTGRGTEELLECEGSADVLMGTLSKAPGTVGGYVSGSRELVTYLRFFSSPAVFSCALPAAVCAGARVAFRIMMDDPEPRERLWANVRAMVANLRSAGFDVADAQSPIIALPVGKNLAKVSRGLYLRGIRCGPVSFPAVLVGQEIMRITINARHTQVDLERCVDALLELRAEGLL